MNGATPPQKGTKPQKSANHKRRSLLLLVGAYYSFGIIWYLVLFDIWYYLGIIHLPSWQDSCGLITFKGLAVANDSMQPMQNSNLKKHIIFSHQALQCLSPNGRSTLDCQTNIVNIWWGKTLQDCLLVKTDPMYVVQWHQIKRIVSVWNIVLVTCWQTQKKKKTYIYYENTSVAGQ